MATAVASKQLTYEDYLALPEMNCRYEILDGELTMAPAPFIEHNWIADNILIALKPYVRRRRLGVVVSAPTDVVVSRRPLRTRQPDVLYVSAARSGFRSYGDLKGARRLDVAPEIVVEVLSGSDKPEPLQEKLDDYCRTGVLECWLVHRDSETVEVLRLSPAGEQSIGTYGAGEMVRSEVLPDLELPVDDVFA